jgi:hypothetical protein
MDEVIDQADYILQQIEQQQSATLAEIKYDPYWDGKKSTAVRCSTDGDPTKYYDPSTQYFERNGGRSLGSLLGDGPVGVVIPRSTRFGISKGWNPHKPCLVNIDPEISGQSSVVDLSKLTKEMVNTAIAETEHIPDPSLAASLAFRKLAIATDPIKLNVPVVGRTDNTQPQAQTRLPPPGFAGCYVVPKATRGGGQEPMPAKLVNKPNLAVPVIEKQGTDPLTPEEAYQIENQMLAEVYARQTPVAAKQPVKSPSELFHKKSGQMVNSKPGKNPQIQVNADVSAPTELVTYEVEGFGQLTTSYHKVVREDICLVLCYDKNFTTGQKFFPQPNKDKTLVVDVTSHPTVYKVISSGIHFSLDNLEICVLLIIEEASK